MRKLIAAITVAATLSAPLAAEASPWGWVEHHATQVAQGVVGTLSIAAGVAGYIAAGNLALSALGAAEVAGTGLALTLGISAIAPIAAGALIALGGYELYQALAAGPKGSDVRRTAETRGFLPQDRPLASTGNIGMHH